MGPLPDPRGAVLRVACVQMQPQLNRKSYNIELSLDRIRDAADAGAQLVVLPELCNTGYAFKSQSEALALAESKAAL